MDFPNVRVIMYHKQSTSARTLFLKLNNTVCAFDGLPTLSQLLEPEEVPSSTVELHPAMVIREAEQRLGMPTGCLEVEGEFRHYVDTPDFPIMILLARFTMIDPPRALVEPHNGKFIALTEARGLSRPELELLRIAYSIIMEG